MNVDVGAYGSGTDRALEQRTPAAAIIAWQDWRLPAVPPSSPAAMAAASPLLTVARAPTRRSHSIKACAGSWSAARDSAASQSSRT